MGSSVDLMVLNLPSKEALAGGGVIAAAGLLGIIKEYRKPLSGEGPIPPTPPEPEEAPREQLGELIIFPSKIYHYGYDDEEAQAA